VSAGGGPPQSSVLERVREPVDFVQDHPAAAHLVEEELRVGKAAPLGGQLVIAGSPASRVVGEEDQAPRW
jgi:hypothetical protein